MKKIASIVLGIALIVPVAASAASCGEIDPITNTVVQCGNGSPETVVNGYGVKNGDVQRLAPGQTVADAAGITSTCPVWFSAQMGCVNIFGTEVYKGQARSLARQLQASGFSLGLYAYWLTH